MESTVHILKDWALVCCYIMGTGYACYMMQYVQQCGSEPKVTDPHCLVILGGSYKEFRFCLLLWICQHCLILYSVWRVEASK